MSGKNHNPKKTIRPPYLALWLALGVAIGAGMDSTKSNKNNQDK